MNLGKPLAVGRTAEIFLWEKTQILKLFRDEWSLDSVNYEFNISKLVVNAGLQVPKVFDVLEVNGRQGIIYEKISGRSMLESMTSSPMKIKTFGYQLANLHLSIHNKNIESLPSQRELLKKNIKKVDILAIKEREQLLDILETLPDDNRLCHGDFHPDNLILAEKGPIIIDWPTASQGSPLADVARTCLMLKFATPPTGVISKLLVRIFHSLFYKSYFTRYFELSGRKTEFFDRWLLLIAGARLRDNIQEEKDILLKFIRSKL